jgi:site-specific DNA recombinase
MQLQDTKHHGRKRLAVVSRVSSEEQAEEGYSLDDQEDKGKALAALHGYSLDDRHIFKGQESGALPLAERPIIQRVLAGARKGQFDVVCFAKIDRMARKLKYMLELWDAFDEAGVAVHIIKESIDTGTPVGRLMRSVLGAVAEFERDTILERTMDGRKKKLRTGQTYLTRPMYGYTYIAQSKDKKVPGTVLISQEQAPIVRRMFELRARGLSWDRIALQFTADRVPTIGGNVRWHPGSIKSVVTNPAYKGEGQYGRRRQVPTGSRRRRIRWITDPAELVPVVYPPIVTPDLWAEANAVESTRHPVRASVDKYLLRGGMVRCAEHDRAMGGSMGESGRRSYRCKRPSPDSRMATHRLTTHGVPAPALDEAVWRDVLAFLADPGRGLAAARRHIEQTAAEIARLEAERAALQREYEAKDAEAAALLRLLRRGTISEQRIEESMREVEEDQARLRAEMAALDARQTVQREDLPRADQALGVCQRLRQGAVLGTPEEKREILDLLAVEVAVDGLAYTITGGVPDLRLAGALAAEGAEVAARTPDGVLR